MTRKSFAAADDREGRRAVNANAVKRGKLPPVTAAASKPTTPPPPPERLNAEQLALLKKISEGGTHVFYTEAFGRQIETAFGVRFVYEHRANTNDPKGLTVDGLGRNAKVMGGSSHDAAEAIAKALGAEGAPGYMMGRGSIQRAALESIRKIYDLDTGERRAILPDV